MVIGREQVRPIPDVMTRLLRVSMWGIFQFLIATASWVGLVRIIADFGDSVLAGYTIAVRIIMFAFLPAWGLSNAVATLVGQNLGAGKPERAERAVWLASYYDMAFLGTVGVLFVVFAEPLVGLFTSGLFTSDLFTSEPEVLASGVSCRRIVSYGYLFYAFGMVVIQAFAVAIAESLVAVTGGWVFRRGHWKKRRV